MFPNLIKQKTRLGKALDTSLVRRCREIGYEIAEWVVDFAGMNHTVVNFDNAYQFIPSGRCV